MLFFRITLLIFLSIPWAINTVAEENMSSLYQKPRIAIVIDDLGDNSVIAKKIIALSAKLTLGILPRTPHSKLIAEWAYEKGHEIILHLPMEAYTRSDLLGPGALYSNMSMDDFSKVIRENIASIPYLSGFNNHMGSLLTEDKERMAWVMEEAKNHTLYFLDSRTSDKSVAEKMAHQNGIQSISRDVFLDHSINQNDMMLQLKHLKFIAKRNGQAVLICHPYPETLVFLKNALGSLSDEYKLVTLSQLLLTRDN